MRLDRLRILRTPGIRTPFTLEPKPGINLVTGPNGAGKSSVCRAVLSLLWPHLIGEEPFEAEAGFTDGARQLRVSRRDLEHPVWEGGSRPNLGPDRLADRYRLGVLELLNAKPSGDPLAREIRNHMAGGFDLGGLRESLFSTRTGRSENGELKAAADNVTGLKKDQQTLTLEQDRLEDLTAESNLARDARDRLATLETLQNLIRKKAAFADAVSRLEGFPAACAAVRPEDPDQLKKLRDLEHGHQKEIENRVTTLAAISREKEEIRTAGGMNPDLPLGLLKKKLEDLTELRRDLRLAEKEAGGQHTDETLAGAAAGPPLWRALLLLVCGIASIVAGALLPVPGPVLLVVLTTLGGGAAVMGILGWSEYSRGASRARLVLDKKLEIARKQDFVARCRGQLDDALIDFNATLAAAGIDPVADTNEAAQLLVDLNTRRDRLNVLAAEHRTNDEFLTRERTDLGRVSEGIKSILDRLGLNDGPGAGAEVAGLLDLVPGFEKATRDREDAGREMDRLSRLLAENSAFLQPEETPNIAEGTLDGLIDLEQKRADDYGKLREEITRIETKVDITRKGHQLQEALAASTAATVALADVRRTNREAALGKLLLDRVERQHEKESRPLVLERADAYFHLFTRRTHRLMMAAQGDGEDRFLAQAEDSVQPLELSELSDGTRAQLLLAVKLAFMTVAEEGARPPIFLDDSLTSADPRRFAAVVASLGELAASEERQIFYLTPNPADAGAIQRALAEANLAPAHLIDLARVRDLAGTADPVLLDPANLPADLLAPDPAGMRASEYAAALLVPRPDPWAPRGMLHVIFVLQDHLDLVRRLVDGNAANLGRFADGRENLVAAGILTADEAALVASGAELWGAWLDGWQLGRARPVTREFLKNSTAVSDKFLGPVTAALEKCGWDGAELLRAIEDREVKGFRTNKLEELRLELEEAGLLAHGAPLAEEDLVIHTRDRVAPLLAANLLDMQKVKALALTFARLVEV